MDKLLEKISSYNLLNYLLPGTIFVILLKEITSFDFVLNDIFLGVFLYYLIGSIISRIGSLIIEPFLIKISFLKFANYSDFVSASQIDPKLDILSEANNMYRTFCSLFFTLLLFKVYELILSKWMFLKFYNIYILIIVLLIIFLFSYKKQTKYITDRIYSNLSKNK
jgi:hypothetical protein